MSRNRKTVVTMVVGVAVSAQMLWGCGAASAASRSSASANRTHTEAPSAPTRVVAKATDHQVVVNWGRAERDWKRTGDELRRLGLARQQEVLDFR